VRIPEDETSRLISGSLWKSAKFIEGNWNDGIKDLAQFWGSQLPTTTPPVESALNWGQFLSGRNPYNSFYRSSIVTPDAFTAGGWPAYKDMLSWQLQQGGVLSILGTGALEQTGMAPE